MDYKKYELKEKRGIRWVNFDKNRALTGIQMRYKATTTNEQSDFKGYVMSTCFPSQMSELEASRHYNILNTKIEIERVFDETKGNENYFTGVHHFDEQENQRRVTTATAVKLQRLQ